MNIGLKTLSELYTGKRKSINSLTAIKIGKYIGIGTDLLIRMQGEYDLYLVYAMNKDEIDFIQKMSLKQKKQETLNKKPIPSKIILIINKTISDRLNYYNEVPIQDIVDFVKKKNISLSKVKNFYYGSIVIINKFLSVNSF